MFLFPKNFFSWDMASDISNEKSTLNAMYLRQKINDFINFSIFYHVLKSSVKNKICVVGTSLLMNNK